MIIKVLSSNEYEDKNRNYGDCFIITKDNEVLIYDCGSEEHALRVIEYLDKLYIDKVKIILSHNDADHFDGILKLLEEDRVEKVYTVLLLKHIDDLLDEIGDGRKTRESIKRQIVEKYDNIAQLGHKGILEDTWGGVKITEGIEVVGPSEEYLLSAFAKSLNTTEGETINSETIVNATSVQVSIDMGHNNKALLCGDCSFAAIEDKFTNYNLIQLPHHGKKDQAEKIFEANKKRSDVLYIVSDNTGTTNGGSDNLITTGYRVKNTKAGDIEVTETTLSRKPIGCLSSEVNFEIFN